MNPLMPNKLIKKYIIFFNQKRMTDIKRTKFINDITSVMKTINSHEDKDWINNAFIKGPPLNSGFIWCAFEGGPDKHWSEKEARGLKFIADFILDLGYETSKFNLFLRVVQNRIKKSFQDDEGKGSDDVRNGFFYKQESI